MKHRFTLSLLSLLALGVGTALAQDYRPFRPGLTYQFTETTTPGDTTHTLRLSAGTRVGADSLFRLSARTSRSYRVPPLGCGWQVQRPNGLFGATLRVSSGSVFTLAATNGRTCILRPRAAAGVAWMAAPGLTAHVTARYLTPAGILPRPDSVAAIALSDGTSLLLSKSFGLLQGPALGHYLSGRQPAKALQLTALPELRTGTARLGALAAYDFQPGDVFLRRTESYGTLPCMTYTWTRDSILTRRDSPGHDTISYQVWRRVLSRLCSNGPANLGPATTITLTYTAAYQDQGSLTEFWDYRAYGTNYAGFIHSTSYRTADYLGRPLQRHAQHYACNPTAVADTIPLGSTGSLDNGVELTTGLGLGTVRLALISFSGEITTLLGYRKGNEQWGQLTSFAQLLPTVQAKAAATTNAFPNPFTQELTVSFELSQPQAVAVELRDALGRVILRQSVSSGATGSNRLQLSTANLPAGLYTLHLLRQSESRPEVLKVLKQ